MNNIKERLLSWAHDPFNRHQISQRHTEILADMRETKHKASVVRAEIEYGFPISRMVGDPKLRGRAHGPITRNSK